MSAIEVKAKDAVVPCATLLPVVLQAGLTQSHCECEYLCAGLQSLLFFASGWWQKDAHYTRGNTLCPKNLGQKSLQNASLSKMAGSDLPKYVNWFKEHMSNLVDLGKCCSFNSNGKALKVSHCLYLEGSFEGLGYHETRFSWSIRTMHSE